MKGEFPLDLVIFDNFEKDPCINGIENKDNLSVMRGVVKFAEEEGVTDNSIREYVVSLLANDENILSLLSRADKQIGSDLYKVAKMDIEQIYKIFFNIPMKYSPSGNIPGFSEEYAESIKDMVSAKTAEELLEKLIFHYRRVGCGIAAKYKAFKFDGKLGGIANTDPITFDDLVGLEFQKQTLIDNTSAFVRGKRANNALLFGDRGTGKSSSVKALLNMFSDKGLRLVEIPKQYISEIPHIMKVLSANPHKFILFLDDLTFEAGETEYKSLKIAMEGQLEANADNILIYATTNRRHLVKETWSDRQGDDVHRSDQIQETLSLSERFGLSIVFSAPDQKEFLKIVSEMLKKYNVEMTAEIEKQAVIWQMSYGGRNGRCAKQFVSSFVSDMDS